MYIEYTPLEGHIQTILRNPATAAALLAHVEAEEAATQVLQVQAEAVQDFDGVNAAAAVAYRIAAPGSAGARVTDTVQERSHFTIKARRSASAENTLRAALELVPNLRVDEEEDEEIAEYELFDVIDADDEQPQQQNSTVQLPSKLQSADNDNEQGTQTNGYEEDFRDLADAGNNIVIELEDEDYDYVVTKVRREPDNKRYRLDNREPRFFHKTYSTPIQTVAKSKSKRSLPSLHPLPAALPRSSSSHNLRQTKSTPGLKLLNGNLHNFYPQRSISEDSNQSVCSSRASSQNSYIYVSHQQRRQEAHSGYNASNINNFEAAEEEYFDVDADFDYIDTTQVKLNNEFPVVERLSTEHLDSQMGIDILNKIRKLLHIQTGTDYEGNDNKRKRRCDNWSPDAADAHQIKYRKVENHFPKIITGPLDDDNIDSFPYPKKPRKPLLLQQHHRSSKSTPLVMSQRSSIHSIVSISTEKPKQRKSLFAPPQTTHKLVKNVSYADVEFSDDDEPELLNGFGFSTSNTGLNSQHSLGKTPKFYNIPISHRAEERLQLTTSSSVKPPPPPLIEARSGSILASSLLPELRSAAGRPTYADTLRQNISSFGGHILGRAPSTASSSGASTSASARANYNGLSTCIRTNPWGFNSRSILTQEKESEDREKYQELLKQLVPRIYGTDENAFTPSIKTQTCTNLARRRSALMLSAANNISASANSSNYANNQQQQQTLAGKLLSKQHQQLPLKRPPLSSTINLDDEDDEDDVTLVDNVLGQRKSAHSKHNNLATVIIDDDDISEIIDLGDEERNMLSACSKLKADLAKGREEEKEKEKENLKKKEELPYVEPVNSLKQQFSTSPHLKDNWLENWQLKWDKKKKERKVEALKIEKEAQKHTDVRRAAEVEIQERLKNFQIFSPDLLVIDDFPEPVVEEEPEFVELNAEYQARIKAAICGPPEQVLVSKFNLNISRRDIHTLLGHSWLNDEVINFYMNLLTERGDLRHDSDGLPRVYAMNTFFIPRLMQAGHGGVKRWTRKVDIFAKDVIPVPVHVGGVHWCMAIIHIKNRTIKYYDSMGTPNPSVLKALEQYLKDESMDKRKQPFDTSQFEVESVRDVPRQMNGSDCGVFSCMFAEYVTRNKEITFSQQHMEYFRHKMILEIVQGELLQ